MRSHHQAAARTLAVFAIFAVIATLAIFAVAPAAAQPPSQPPAGYFPIDELALLDPEVVSVDINLTGAMLRLVGAAVFEEEPELSGLVNQLESLRVLIAAVEDVDLERLDQGIGRGVAHLEALGWQRVVKVRDEGEQVHIYVREADGQIGGLTILAVDPVDEVVLINLAGIIDVEQIAQVARAFDVGSVEEALGAGRARRSRTAEEASEADEEEDDDEPEEENE